MAIERNGEVFHDLCFVPDKPDNLSLPVRVDELEQTDAAVFRMGPEESMIVTREPDGSKLITAREPALVYLTPNLSQYPGVRAKYVKILKTGEREWRTYFSKDKARWDEWTPSKERV